MDLIRLTDGDTSVRVRILGRRSPGNLQLHDLLDAEVVLETSFISGRLAICCCPADLNAWSQALDALGAGRDIEWLDLGNGPVIRIEAFNEEQETPVVTIEDGWASCTTAVVPLDLADGWVDEQRRLLDDVVRIWPSETRQTAPGVYEWRR
ncbi:DUF5959 family protein [Kitasatospora aureofaciens]|uniref:DUF5959 family protein n=1 Tax=Kitasatospora aureofaciens TaxID=1894 RepID=UPI001C4874EF|nr:DUF5959 family protein [Kitasatospora aureofaciens]MBV6696616.1 hypothetical protein [Kitasatospora aureofaciens]